MPGHPSAVPALTPLPAHVHATCQVPPPRHPLPRLSTRSQRAAPAADNERWYYVGIGSVTAAVAAWQLHDFHAFYAAQQLPGRGKAKGE